MYSDHKEYYGVASTPTDDYLAHYGVLGMKWGIRRAAKKGLNYSYKSHATKKYNKLAAKLAEKSQKTTGEKADKLKAKSAKMANRARRSAEIDRGEEEYARGLSTGDAVGLAFLGGTGALKGYAQHRAMSKQKGKEATGHKVAAGLATMHGGTIGSRLRKANYIRQDEKSNGIGRKLYNLDNNIHDAVASIAEPITKRYNKTRKRRG